MASVLTSADEQSLEDRIYFRVERQMAQRQIENRTALEFWIKTFGGSLLVLAVVAGIFGYRNIGDINTQFSEKIDTAVERLNESIVNVSDSLDRTANDVFDEREQQLLTEVSRVERFMLIRDLVERTNTLHRNEQVPAEEVATVMRQIGEFAEDISSGRSPEALNAMATFSGVLYQSNRFAELRRLAELFPQLVRSNTAFRNNMMEALLLVVMEPDPRKDDMELFEDLRRAAWEQNWGETALAYDIILRYQFADANDEAERVSDIERMFERATDFDQGEMLNFANVFGAMLSPDAQANMPRSVHHEITRVAQSVLADHTDKTADIFTEEILEQLIGIGLNGGEPLFNALVEAGKL